MKLTIHGVWFDQTKQTPEQHDLNLDLSTANVETHAFFSERPEAWEKLHLAIREVLEEAVRQ
jgi:hypothetical protein